MRTTAPQLAVGRPNVQSRDLVRHQHGPDPGDTGQDLRRMLLGSIDSLSSRADPPSARRITVTVELKGRHVVVGAPPTGDCQALAGLDVADLEDTAAARRDPPDARGIAVAVVLKRLQVVFGAPPPGDRQALAGLHVADLIDTATARVDAPGARRIAIAVVLKSRHVVVGAPPPAIVRHLPVWALMSITRWLEIGWPYVTEVVA